MSAVITPTLFLGPPQDRAWLSDLEIATTAEEAALYINAGRSALLPEGRFDLAEQTLRLLGVDEAWIRNRIHYARTGELPEGEQCCQSGGPGGDGHSAFGPHSQPPANRGERFS
jgi:hypothetical protein